MNQRQLGGRRSFLKAAASAAGLAAAGGVAIGAEARIGAARSADGPGRKQTGIRFKNKQFYDASGKFLVEKAKDAIFALLEFHGYPIFDGLREGLWVSDYALRHFAELGLAAYIFMNEEENNYLMLDIFLLPDQMLPEHYHLKTDKAEAKMEGWLCRHGRSYVYGEGPKTDAMHAVIPEYEKQWVTTFHETILDPGQSTHLNRKTARHWQFAGPEGAILTEVGTFHDGAGVRHTDPNIVFE